MPVKITAICRVIYVICFYSNCKIVGFLIYFCPFCKTVLFKSNYKTYMHDKTNNNLAAILFIIRKTDLVNFFLFCFLLSAYRYLGKVWLSFLTCTQISSNFFFSGKTVSILLIKVQAYHYQISSSGIQLIVSLKLFQL